MRMAEQSALADLNKRIVTSVIDAGAMGSGPASMTIESAAKRFGHTNQIKLPSHNLTVHQHTESGNVVVHHGAQGWLHQSAHGQQCGTGSGPASLHKHLKACMGTMRAGGPGSGRHSSGNNFPEDHEFTKGDKVSFNHPTHGSLTGEVISPSKPTLSVGYKSPTGGGYKSVSIHHTKVYQP